MSKYFDINGWKFDWFCDGCNKKHKHKTTKYKINQKCYCEKQFLKILDKGK